MTQKGNPIYTFHEEGGLLTIINNELGSHLMARTDDPSVQIERNEDGEIIAVTLYDGLMILTNK